MKINRKKTRIALAISSALILSACGSDGNSGSGSGTSAQLTLTAMDGYIKNALVCADSNENGQCETTEIVRDLNGNYVITNDQGKIDTQISLDNKDLLKKHTMIIATLRSFDPESDIFSEDMDLPEQSMNPIVLRAPAGSSMVSPITDLVVAKMQGAEEDEQPGVRAPKMNKTQAQKEVLAALDGIDPEKLLTKEMLYGDYLLDKNLLDEGRKVLAQRNHKVAQIIFESKANAKSDALFDKHAEEVTTIAVTAVSTMSSDLLEDTAHKPYVAVGTNGASTDLVLNKKVKFNKENMALLAVELGKVEGLYGTHEQWKDRTIYLDGLTGLDEDTRRDGIEALITDKDDAAHDEFHDIYISNKTKLAKSNLLVKFQHATEVGVNRDHILISRADKSKGVPGGTYSILISTNDLNEKGQVIKVTDENDTAFQVVSTSVTPLLFTVTNENTAPQVNDERLQEINQEIESWKLKQGDIMTSRILDLNGLFTDINGDSAFEYSMDFNIPGLKVTKDSDSIFRISGQPLDVAEGEVMTVTATDNGGLKTEAGITVNIEEGYSELVETLTQSDSIWYQWSSKEEPKGTVSPYCQGIKLTADTYGYNGNYTAISSANTCPSEHAFDARKISGTWKADNSDLLLKSISGKERRYGGIKKHNETGTDSNNITVFEKLIQPRMRMLSEGELKIDETSKYNGVTLYKGHTAAENSLKEGTAISLINGIPVIATADATHEKYSNADEKMTFNVSFNATCEALGLKAPEKTINYAFNRFEKIQAIVEGKAYDFKLNKPVQPVLEAQNAEAENCLVKFKMDDFDKMNTFEFNKPLAMNFVAKEGLNDSDMFINGLFDKKGTIVPLVDFSIVGNGEGTNNNANDAIYIAYPYSGSWVKVGERFFNGKDGSFVRERSVTGELGGIFGEYFKVSTEYAFQYQAKNNKLVYEFKGDCTKMDCKTINLWSDISGKVTIFTHGTNPDLNGHYPIYKSWNEAEDSFKKD